MACGDNNSLIYIVLVVIIILVLVFMMPSVKATNGANGANGGTENLIGAYHNDCACYGDKFPIMFDGVCVNKDWTEKRSPCGCACWIDGTWQMDMDRHHCVKHEPHRSEWRRICRDR